jgi:hypothetical protein
MLLAVVLWAAYSLCLRRRPRELAPTSCSPPASCRPSCCCSAGSRWRRSRPDFAMTARLAGSLAYIVVFASLAGFLLWSYGVAAIGPERAGLFVNLMPLFGALQAIALLDESLQPSHIGGASACSPASRWSAPSARGAPHRRIEARRVTDALTAPARARPRRAPRRIAVPVADDRGRAAVREHVAAAAAPRPRRTARRCSTARRRARRRRDRAR